MAAVYDATSRSALVKISFAGTAGLRPGSYVAIDRQRFTYYRAPRVESYFAYSVARYHHISAGDGGLRGTMAVGFFHTELDVDGACDRKVPLAGVVHTFANAQRLHRVADEGELDAPAGRPDGARRLYGRHRDRRHRDPDRRAGGLDWLRKQQESSEEGYGLLDKEPGWRRIYTDRWAVVHVRGEAPEVR